MICEPGFIPIGSCTHILYEENDALDELSLDQFYLWLDRKKLSRTNFVSSLEWAFSRLIRDDLYIYNGRNLTLRLSYKFWELRLAYFRHWEADLLRKFRHEFPELVSSFDIGFPLDDDLLAAMRNVNASVEEAKTFPNFALRGDDVISEHIDPINHEAVRLNHFYFQDRSPNPYLLWNRETDQLDFDLFEKSQDFLSSCSSPLVDRGDLQIIEALRPYDGGFLCLSEESIRKLTVEKLVSACKNERSDGAIRWQKKGRKPSPAKKEFYRRYPNGKPSDLSFDAIAAELTADGFQISARAIQNYENERTQ